MATTWVPLLVPQADYLELAAIVAERSAQRRNESGGDLHLEVKAAPVAPEATGASEVKAAALEKLKPWTLEHLRRLAKGETVTTQRWTQVLDLCSQPEHVGEFLSTQQVAAETGMRIEEWRDAPRKIQRHLDRHYEAGLTWPLAVISGRRLGHSYDQAYWGINKEQAARWKSVRSETQ